MRNIIYGAGFAGKVLAHYLTLFEGIKVEALVVSPGHKEMDEYMLSTELMEKDIRIPVVELSREIFDTEVCVYVTVVSGKEEVIRDIKKIGNKNVRYVIAQELYPGMFNAVFNLYFERKQCFKNTNIEFNGLKLFDFRKIDMSFFNTFIGTVGDEILPSVYGDFAFAVDGPYEGYNVNLSKNDVIIDAGANLGLFSCYAANLGCKVYACDPDSRCLAVLEKQRELYPKNIEIIPVGLSDEVGSTTFYESEDCGISSFSLVRGKGTECTIKLETIDHLVESGMITHIDYIKADIEGAERNMLRGAVKTLKEFAPKLSICTYHYKEDPQLLEQIIKEANPEYIVTHAWRKLYAYVPTTINNNATNS